jgi:hypothetical protein
MFGLRRSLVDFGDQDWSMDPRCSMPDNGLNQMRCSRRSKGSCDLAAKRHILAQSPLFKAILPGSIPLPVFPLGKKILKYRSILATHQNSVPFQFVAEADAFLTGCRIVQAMAIFFEM